MVYDLYGGAEATAYRNVQLAKKTTRQYGAQDGNTARIKTGSFLTFTTTYNYDNSNYENHERLLRSVTESSPSRNENRITSFEYKNSPTRYIVGLLAREETSSGDVTTRVFNDDGTVRIQNTNGVETSFTYSQGNVITQNTNGKVHRTENYQRGIPTTETDPEGRVVSRVVNPNGTLASESVPGGSGIYSYQYDQLQRNTRITYPGSLKNPTVIEYPTQSKSIKKEEGGSSYVATELDGFGRVIRVESLNNEPNTPEDRRINATYYDSEGQIVKEIYPTERDLNYIALAQLPSVQTTYDGAGRKIRTEATVDVNTGETRVRSWTRTIDNGREMLKYKDGRNAVQTLSFDSFGSPKQEFLISMIDGNGVETVYDRDPQGRLNSMSRDGQTRNYYYNARKELRAEVHPESGETSYQYYDDGLLRTRTNNGRVANYTYKADNQIDEIRWNDGRASVTMRHYYNSQGLLQSAERNAANSAFTVYSAYGYDALGRLSYEKNTDNGSTSLQMSYQYDFVGNLSRITYPNNRTYELTPNYFGQNTTIKEPGGKEVLSGVTYYPNGAYSTIQSGVNMIRSERNDMFQVASRKHDTGGASDVHQRYAYDSESNMSYLSDEIAGKSQTMTYDSAGRLKTVSGTRLGNRSFDYNAKDDIIFKNVDGFQHSYIYNWKGHLTEVTSANPTRVLNYNVHGEVVNMHTNPTQEPTGLNYMELVRDPEGRLVETSMGTQYGYDYRGLRFITENGGRTYTYYDINGKLRFRWDQMANVETEYHYVGNELIAKRELYLSAGSGSGDDPSNGGTSSGTDNIEIQSGYTVNHTTLTISWTSNNWHQVQKSDGTGIGCDGGSSCTVPEPGNYVAISFGSSVDRTPIIVQAQGNSDGTDTQNTNSSDDSNNGYLVDNATLTISWTSPNWHQVQRSDGSSIGCDGGQSCTVPVPGDYVAISFGDSVIRTAVRVDGDSAFNDGNDSSSQTDASSGTTQTGGGAEPPGEQQGDYYVDHATQVIRWTINGWHQIQKSDGTNIGCDGGNECSVPGTGNYVGINHDTGVRTALMVRSESNSTEQSASSETASSGSDSASSTDGEQQGNYTVDHAALVIRWSTAGWHQIQNSDGSGIGCDGGNSCTVPSAGDYTGINHSTGLRTSLTVNGGAQNATAQSDAPSDDSPSESQTGSSNEQQGDYSINHDTLTVSWSVSGWHQVQRSDGSDIGCNGGTSCTVPTAGDYIVINHGTGQRQTMNIGGTSSVTTDGDYTINSATKTISWSVSGWHQVQRSNGGDIGCNGGYSCTVPEAGSYIAINHGTGSRTPLVVN